MKRVGKTTRTFWYDLNQIPYDYTVKVTNRFKGLDLIYRVHLSSFPASSSISSCQIDEETLETVRDFILGGLKMTADGDCSHEMKRHLLLGRKAMINLDNILKSRDYFANKGPSSQSYGFFSSHVWM